MTGKFRRKKSVFLRQIENNCSPKREKFMEDFSLKKIKNQIIELFEH